MSKHLLAPRSAGASVFIIAFFAAVGCDSAAVEAEAPPPAARPTLRASVLDERDFVRDPELRADLSSTVVIELESPNGPAPDLDTGKRGVDEIPYVVAAAEAVHLCVEPAGGDAHEIEILDAKGNVVLHAKAGEPCVSGELQPGAYRTRATYDPRSTDLAPKTIFVHASETPDPKCPAVIDPLVRPGNAWEMLSADTQRVIDAVVAYQFQPARYKARSLPFLLDVGSAFTRVTDGLTIQFTGRFKRVAEIGGTPRTLGYRIGAPGATFELAPIAGSPWSFQPYLVDGSDRVPWTLEDVNGKTTVRIGGDHPRASVVLGMRYAPSPELVGDLAAGEVALYAGPAFTGPAWVINTSNAFPQDFALFTSEPGTENFRRLGPQSIRSSCGTTVALYPSPARAGRATLVSTDDGSGDFFMQAGGFSLSAFVRATREIVVETRACSRCNLRGAKLAKADLSSVHFRHVDLTGAVLTEASLQDAVLEDVKLDGAELTGTRFQGATFMETSFAGVDLRKTAFDPAPRFQIRTPADGQPITLDPSRQCLDGPPYAIFSTFAGATISPGQFAIALWPYLDLAGIKIDTSAGPVDLSNQPLCSLRLANAQLDGVKLSGARLDRTDLRGAHLAKATGDVISFKGADLSGAHLDGAVLSKADFADAKLVNASIEGATFVDASFNPVTATGLQLTNATFKRCTFRGLFNGATGEYATFDACNLNDASFDGLETTSLSGASFVDSFLENARLSNVQLYTASFENTSLIGAVVVNSRFDHARFSRGTKLVGIQAQAAQFGNARFFGVDLSNASFTKSQSGAPVTFEAAYFCGGNLLGPNMAGAVLTGAFFPKTDIDVPGPDGSLTKCSAVDVSTVITTKETICPSGRKPADLVACAGADWTTLTPPPPPCCVSTPTTKCPMRKKKGVACTTGCDCDSETCANNKCL